MFLNQLSEKEKDAFISLSVHASNANGVFAEEEKIMIEEYCKEMSISFFDAKDVKSMDEVIAVFKESDLHIKKIVLLETLGLVYSDGNYDDEEKGFIKEFAGMIELEKSDVEKLTEVIKKYLEVLKEIGEIIA